VITEAGNDPKVAALVYITAFAPDTGESVSTLIKDAPPGAPFRPSFLRKTAFCFSTHAKFAASFAADVDPKTAQFMADSQVPWGGPGAWGNCQRRSMEIQAELVSSGNR